MKVIILSLPHMSSSLLLNLLSNCGNTNVDHKERTRIHNYIPNKVNIIKFPLWNPKLERQIPTDYHRIYLIREPRYMFASLRKRFPRGLPKDHKYLESLTIWQKYLDLIKSTEIHTLVYPDYICSQNLLKSICEDLTIEYSEDIWSGHHKRWIVNEDVPKEKPNPENHIAFRNYQLNQPITNMNRDFVYNSFIAKIEALESYQNFF